MFWELTDLVNLMNFQIDIQISYIHILSFIKIQFYKLNSYCQYLQTTNSKVKMWHLLCYIDNKTNIKQWNRAVLDLLLW